MTGQTIRATDLQDVVEQQNWSVCNAQVCLISQVTAAGGWDGSGFGTHYITIDEASLTTRFEFPVWIDEDAFRVYVDATVDLPVAHVVSVRFIVGGTNRTLNTFTAGTISTVFDDMSTAQTGIGAQLVQVQVRRDSGGSQIPLMDFRVQCLARDPTTLAAPTEF